MEEPPLLSFFSSPGRSSPGSSGTSCKPSPFYFPSFLAKNRHSLSTPHSRPQSLEFSPFFFLFWTLEEEARRERPFPFFHFLPDGQKREREERTARWRVFPSYEDASRDSFENDASSFPRLATSLCLSPSCLDAAWHLQHTPERRTKRRTFLLPFPLPLLLCGVLETPTHHYQYTQSCCLPSYSFSCREGDKARGSPEQTNRRGEPTRRDAFFTPAHCFPPSPP